MTVSKHYLVFAVLIFLTGTLSQAKTPFTGYMMKRSTSLSSCAADLNGQVPYGAPIDFKFSGNFRRYYIAADEETWDYAPTGWDNWLGLPIQHSPRARSAGYLKFGTTWQKALYRGYTDATFTTRSQQAPWQGTQGPTIRAEQNDMIEILFYNNLRSNYASMHSMGLAYNKNNEGSDYPNTIYPTQPSSLPMESAVSPKICVVYKWLVNTPEGPNMNLPARLHAYHSFVSYQEDTNAGLAGPTIIYAPGQMNSTMAGNREITLLYMIYNENDSWLSAQNKARLNGSATSEMSSSSTIPTGSSIIGSNNSSNESYWYPQLVNYNASSQFSSAPSFHTMNGYVFANNPVFDMCLNDKVIWYTYAYGSASHAFHMHGNGFKYQGSDMDVIGECFIRIKR